MSVKVKFDDGHEIVFSDEIAKTGMSNVGRADVLINSAKDSFVDALGGIANVITSLQSAVNNIENRPNKIEMEFGASVKGKGSLLVVSADTAAQFKIRITW